MKDGIGPSQNSLPVSISSAPMSECQKDWLTQTFSLLNEKRALELNETLTNIYSYTGHEREINEYVVNYFSALGMDSHYQAIDNQMGNAIIPINGDGTGPTLLAISPVDTHWSGDVDVDGGQWGIPMRRDNLLPAQVEGKTVIGLGSNNIKATMTALILATEAINKANIPLKGSLISAFVCGAAPALSPLDEERKNISFGTGVLHMLTRGVWSDFALYHKPGWDITWDDTSLNYFKISLFDEPQYLGTPDNTDNPYRLLQDIVKVIEFVDAFRWGQTSRTDQSHPITSVSMNSIRFGRPDKPNWSPAQADLFLDIRANSSESPLAISRILEQALTEFRSKHTGMRLDLNQYASIPGAKTSPTNWIVQSAIRASQFVAGKQVKNYPVFRPGQTEASLLRSWGIPTAKIGGTGPQSGLSPDLPSDIKGFTMSGSYAPYIIKAAKVMIYTIIDTLTRTRSECGLTKRW
mgnify:CR=1 FL=1